MDEYKTNEEMAQEYAQSVAEKHNLSDEMKELINLAFIAGHNQCFDDYDDDYDGECGDYGYMDNPEPHYEVRYYKDEEGNLHGVKAEDFPEDMADREVFPSKSM